MKNWHLFLWIVVAAVGGFVLGQAKDVSELKVTTLESIEAERAMVTLTKIEGERLSLDIEGNVRVVWSEEHFLDTSGDVFLGQVPDANDLQYRQYPLVGNANTGKFYPSTTNWARGVRVKDRRFFATKEAAIAAGFIPTKSLQ